MNDRQPRHIMPTLVSNLHAVFYCDGSSFGNPGPSGYGIYGYTYIESKRPKNIKHPTKKAWSYTPDGMSKDKHDTPIEVVDIHEVIKSIGHYQGTNNEAELLAMINGLEKGLAIEGLSSMLVITDSNYVVTSFNTDVERWAENRWKKRDGRTISHAEKWQKVYQLKQQLVAKNIKVVVKWVKGHSDEYGNDQADLFACVASNAARYHLQNNEPVQQELLLDAVSSYSDYKKSYHEKDLIMQFRDLYFSSIAMKDESFCFIASSEDQNNIGKRDTASLLAINVGFIPAVVNNLRQIFRAVPRNYNATCCIKLNKLENRDILRLMDYVPTHYMVSKIQKVTGGRTSYELIKDSSSPFMFEMNHEFPFMVDASKLFNTLATIYEDVSTNTLSNSECVMKDISDKFISENKIVFTNKHKSIDLTDVFQNEWFFKQKPIVTIGHDVPSYLTLKSLEENIDKVNVIMEKRSDSNFCTMYTHFIMKDRVLLTANVSNKFLALKK